MSMKSNIVACSLAARCASYAAQTFRSASVEASLASCSSRGYATEGDDAQGMVRRTRRPMRYGSKLAMRNPEAFRRMQAILGYPDDESVGKVDRVTISMLQTFKYLMDRKSNVDLLEGMASYKVTSLNRELEPLLARTQALLTGPKQGPEAGAPGSKLGSQTLGAARQ